MRTGCPDQPTPASRALTIASARLATCIFANTLDTWFRTVLGERYRRSAIAAFVNPLATQSSISRSRSVNSGKGALGALRLK